MQKVVANIIQTNEIKIGSQEKPTGITIYDKLTGEPYCVFVEGGQMKTVAGECSITVEVRHQQEQPEPSVEPLLEPSVAPEPSPEPSPVVEPLSSSEPIPEPISEPIIESPIE
ncbi:MAG: hypothetical protein COX42_00940, partial [Parcubacteria group bacterium CG23_combo_of_CG06-09_8_20_14_all_35_6]